MSVPIRAKGTVVPCAQDDFWCVHCPALYFAVTTLTTVGNGDITLQNKVEYGIGVVSTLFFCYAWAFIVGTIDSILSNLDLAAEELEQNLDDIGELPMPRRLPRDLQVRLWSSVHETRRTLLDSATSFRVASAGLQRLVAQWSAAVQGMLRGVVCMQHLS